MAHPHRHFRTLLLGAALGAISIWPAQSHGAPAPEETAASTAKALNEAASLKLGAKDYPAAESRYKAAFALARSPQAGLGLARALAAQDRLVEALAVYREVALMTAPKTRSPLAPKPEAEAIETAAEERTKLEARLPWLIVRLGSQAPASASLTLDGKAIPAEVWIAVNPGAHQLSASAEGFHPKTLEHRIEASQRTPLELVLAPLPPPEPPPPPVVAAPPPVVVAPPPPPPTRPVAPPPEASNRGLFMGLGIGSLAVGAAGIGLGIGFGVMVLDQRSELEQACVNFACPKEYQESLDTTNGNATISTIGFIAGGAFAAAGVVLLAVAPPAGGDQLAARVKLEAGPNGVRLGGHF